jgi:hypothetical protein
VQLLAHDDPRVRSEAAGIIGNSREAHAVAILISRLDIERQCAVRISTIDALAALRDEAAIPHLLQRAAKTEDAVERARLISSIDTISPTWLSEHGPERLRWIDRFVLRVAKGARRERVLSRMLGGTGELRQHDLVETARLRLIDVIGIGGAITYVDVTITNLTDYRLRIRMSPGTCFVATGQCQDMAVRREECLELSPRGMATQRVAAVCVNAARPIPKNTDRFHKLRSVPDDLRRFLCATENADPMVVQAGVWSLTDRYTPSQIRARLHNRDSAAGRVSEAITNNDVMEAKRILDGLRIRSHL